MVLSTILANRNSTLNSCGSSHVVTTSNQMTHTQISSFAAYNDNESGEKEHHDDETTATLTTSSSSSSLWSSSSSSSSSSFLDDEHEPSCAAGGGENHVVFNGGSTTTTRHYHPSPEELSPSPSPTRPRTRRGGRRRSSIFLQPKSNPLEPKKSVSFALDHNQMFPAAAPPPLRKCTTGYWYCTTPCRRRRRRPSPRRQRRPSHHHYSTRTDDVVPLGPSQTETAAPSLCAGRYHSFDGLEHEEDDNHSGILSDGTTDTDTDTEDDYYGYDEVQEMHDDIWYTTEELQEIQAQLVPDACRFLVHQNKNQNHTNKQPAAVVADPISHNYNNNNHQEGILFLSPLQALRQLKEQCIATSRRTTTTKPSLSIPPPRPTMETTSSSIVPADGDASVAVTAIPLEDWIYVSEPSSTELLDRDVTGAAAAGSATHNNAAARHDVATRTTTTTTVPYFRLAPSTIVGMERIVLGNTDFQTQARKYRHSVLKKQQEQAQAQQQEYLTRNTFSSLPSKFYSLTAPKRPWTTAVVSSSSLSPSSSFEIENDSIHGGSKTTTPQEEKQPHPTCMASALFAQKLGHGLADSLYSQ